MNRTNYLHLSIGLAFVVLLVLSLINELSPRVVIGYSFSAFLFSLTDLINTTFENKRKYSELIKENFSKGLEGYISGAKEQSDESIGKMKETNSDIAAASNKLLHHILESKFDFAEAQKNGFNEPSQKLLKDGSLDMSNFSGFDMLASAIEDIKPTNKTSAYDYVNHILIMLAIVIIISIPFVPDELIKNIFGPNMVSVGTSITLLSLSIIFITSFIRNHYIQLIEKIQLEKYYEMKKILDESQFWMQSIFKDIANEKENFSTNLDGFSQLLNIGIKRELDKDRNSN